jgi:hypothetical protein
MAPESDEDGVDDVINLVATELRQISVAKWTLQPYELGILNALLKSIWEPNIGRRK